MRSFGSALLLLVLGASLSGCVVERRAYVASPRHHRTRVVHTERRESPQPVIVESPPPQEHVHRAGCGHILVGGIWVNASSPSIGGSVCASVGGLCR